MVLLTRDCRGNRPNGLVERYHRRQDDQTGDRNTRVSRDDESARSPAAPTRVRNQKTEAQGNAKQHASDNTESAGAVVGLRQAVTKHREQEREPDNADSAVHKRQRHGRTPRRGSARI